MKRVCRYCIPVICLLIFISSCRQQPQRFVERGFYYWKSKLLLGSTELNSLQQLQVQQLYVKYFDVTVASDGNGSAPVARLTADSLTLVQLKNKNIAIVPVVFITNETLQQSDSAALRSLAKNITVLLTNISKQLTTEHYSELQIDCDWTQATKAAYFFLLQQIKSQMQSSVLFKNSLLSATIRLHQVKFSSRTGIPPVDKGLLMCYNMGNLKNPATGNSIIEVEELKKYLSGLSSYPLKLDVALPLFEWSVLFRNNQFKGIVQTVDPSTLSSSICTKQNNRYRFLVDTSISNIQFYKGDVLRYEESSSAAIKETAGYVSKHLSSINQQTRILLYHLDPLLLSKHPTHELEALYSRFHQQ
ncbi:hypothetical protein ESA94_13015 [Lacibacter luteus]|uniref:Uncharacterized protein n=1 Tax=Lacibacter luteus TaxID=2508719 RepID=A0A4V1M7I2_9BACT|nr:hypothetical protein [Lacibacter luteus]RXK59962.1 hypothetical protein ESA94_13015 [Lacibacter luteus]